MGLGTKATPMWRWVLEIHKKEPVLRSSCLLQVMPWWHVMVPFHTKSDKSQVSTRWSLTRTSKRQRLLKATGTQSSRNSLALSLFRWGKILSSIFDHRTFSKLNPMGNEVFFEVWDKDRLSKDDLMGKVVALLIWKSILSVGRKCYIKKPNCNKYCRSKWSILSIGNTCCRPLSCWTHNYSQWPILVPSSVFLFPRSRIRIEDAAELGKVMQYLTISL